MRSLASLGAKYRTSFVMAVKSFPSEQVTALAEQELGGFEYSNGKEFEFVRGMERDKLLFLLNRPYFRSEDMLTATVRLASRPREARLGNDDHGNRNRG